MTTDHVKQRLPLSAWQSEQLRLTAFPRPEARVVSQGWWEEVAGSPAEMIQQDVKRGIETEEGFFGEGRLVLAIQPSRIDWIYTAGDPSAIVDSFLVLGPFPETVETFRSVMAKWLNRNDVPPITRLAFGAVLLSPVSERTAIYDTYSNYLPIAFDKFDKENTHDFHYQINRRRSLQEIKQGLRVNRLSKWGEASLRIVDLDGSIRHPEKYACRLELDINSVPGDELRLDRLSDLFDDFIKLGQEIVREGDIP